VAPELQSGWKTLRFALQCVLAAALCVAAAVAVPASDTFSVKVDVRGTEVHVEARALVQAPAELVWETISDYERLPQFVPGIQSTRVLERRDNVVLVELHGSAGFLFIRIPVDAVVESVENRPHAMEARLVRGNLRKLDGRYRIVEGAPGEPVELGWQGVIEPAKRLPPLVGPLIMRANLTDQFRGLVDEIGRRQAQRTGAPAPR
jgi:ribosome-associated toxin RatA of RatAB toxin-antitoxin module